MQINNYSIYIVTYHYVREAKKSKYKNLKILEFNEFKKQVKYFKKNFNILDPEDFIKILSNKKLIKKPSILLTFDDGYKDHYDYVFPFLKKEKIKGCFYPPSSIVGDKAILDVNKIQFFLSIELDRKKLFFYISSFLKDEFNISLDKVLEKNKKLIVKLKSRHDDDETILIKALLQKFLPIHQRKYIIDRLFKKIVTKNYNQFSSELYLNSSNIKEMIKGGMHFGSHGCNHEWWANLTKNKQEKEILNSIKFLYKLGVKKKNLSVCYPYGSFDKHSISLLKKYSINFGLTTVQKKVDKKNIGKHLALPRFDTNQFKTLY